MPAPANLRERIAATLQRAWQRRGPLSTMLVPAAWAFGAAARARGAVYERGWRERGKLSVPVVVVGNVLVGGAGKTPTVLAIVATLRRNGYRPGIISRGYGRAGDEVALVDADAGAERVGDEPLLLRRRAGVPVAVGADRVAVGQALLRMHPELDAIVSDDGLQHLALERDVEVLVFDERGDANGRLLPAGPLRERVPAALGAAQLVVYNADAPTTALPGYCARRALAGVVPLGAWWTGAAPEAGSLEALRGRKVVAVAGIARPQRFFAMLRAHALDIVELPLGDHADFSALPWPTDAGDVVVTEKDAVKLPPSRPLSARVWVARLDFVPGAAFDAALLALLPPPTSIDAHGNTPP